LRRFGGAFSADRAENRLAVPDGLKGKLASTKWAVIERCSPDTALRDIQDLIDQGILAKDAGGGRSTSYSLVTESGVSPHR
jgi:Fic family protein